MASIIKRGNRWRASVCKNGQRKTATFDSKTEARLWANQTEIELEDRKKSNRMPFTAVLERYREEVSAKKRCFYTEKYMIGFISRADFAKKPISEITPADIAEWRDSQTLANNTVLRAMAVISQVFKTAVNEWGIAAENPMAKVRKPSIGKPRNRRISPKEIQDIAAALGWKPPPMTIQDIAVGFIKDSLNPAIQDIAAQSQEKQQRTTSRGSWTTSQYRFSIAVAFLLAIETGMRQREILGLNWGNIDLIKRTVHLPITKNGDSRNVPLSQTAVSLLEQMRTDSEKLFLVGQNYVQTEIKRITKSLGIENLHFHDTRHEAVTRLARKIGVLDLARMIGHRNISQLMIYYNPSAEEIAKKLD